MKENNENCEIGFLGYWLGAVEGFFFSVLALVWGSMISL